MRFLVLGCNGMAGHMISTYLAEQGHDVVGFARKKSDLVQSVVGDAQDVKFIEKTVRKGGYDTVINCIGVLNQFAENGKSTAAFLNGYLPHFLAEVTSGTDTQVIHMSTDCVFSGKRGQYTEEDLPDGATFYDRSKALGELDDGKNLTLRNSIVGPDLSPKGIGLLNWFMQQHGTVNGYTKAIWTGQTTLQLAKTMESAAQQRVHGLINMVPDGSISKYELLKLFNHYLRNDQIEIIPVDNALVDKSLKRTRFEFDYTIPSYQVMVEQMAEWMMVHKHLYPHYGL